MAELAHLRTFLAVYRARSITRGAEQLRLSQPTATAHLRALEARTVEPLFLRLARGVAPTARAHALARELAPHLDAVDDIVQTLATSRPTGGLVRLGGPPDLLAVKVLPAVAPLLQRGLRIHARPGATPDLLRQLRRRQLDLAVMPGKESGDDLVQTPLFTERLVLVAAPALAQRIDVAAVAAAGAQALEGVPLVAYTEELPIIRVYFNDVFGQPPTGRAALVVNDLRAVVQAVMAGAGISVLPAYHASDAIARGHLVELHRPPRSPTNPVYLTHLHGPLPPGADMIATTPHRAAPQWEHH